MAKQVRPADGYGNLLVSGIEARTITLDADPNDTFDWDGLPFLIKVESDAKVKVALMGEEDTDAKVLPFTKGLNQERVRKAFHDGDNSITGLIVAVR